MATQAWPWYPAPVAKNQVPVDRVVRCMSVSSQIPFASSGTTRRYVLILAGWALIACYVGAVAFVRDWHEHVRVLQVAWIVGFAGYALVVRSVWSVPASQVPGNWRVWLLGFVVLRLALLHTVPSDDLHRYAWEGKIQRAGFNPYLIAPDDDRLRSLRAGDPNWSHINHPDYSAIYPPVAQLLFRSVACVSDSVYAMKGVFVGCEIAFLVLLGQMLIRRGLSPFRVAVYALNPLSFFAFAIDGHLDALMLLALVAAADFADRRRMYACAVALGLAIASKLVAVVLLPWLLWRHGGMKATALALMVFVLSWLPYAGGGLDVLSSLTRFAGEMTVLAPVVALLEILFNQGAARVLAAGGLAIYLLLISRKGATFSEYATRAFAGLLLALPVFHAWYLTWFLVFAWARVRVSWLVLTAVMGLYFEGQRGLNDSGTWGFPAWAPEVMLAVFLIALVVETLWRRRVLRALDRCGGSAQPEGCDTVGRGRSS